MKPAGSTRREFVGGALALSALGVMPVQARGKEKKERAITFELGMASYSLRNFKLDEAIKITARAGLKHIALKSMHLPLELDEAGIDAAIGKLRDGGLNPYGVGVVYMKTEEQVARTFAYAKTAGVQVIIGVPDPQLLKMVEKKVKEYDIKVAIHNHGPGDKTYPTPAVIAEKIKGLDRRIGICMDTGHTVRAGDDPADAVRKYADRLHDVHLKDVTEASAKGKCVELGRGVMNVQALMRSLIETGYSGVAAFEFEKDPSDPMPGIAESVGYAKGVMATLA